MCLFLMHVKKKYNCNRKVQNGITYILYPGYTAKSLLFLGLCIRPSDVSPGNVKDAPHPPQKILEKQYYY